MGNEDLDFDLFEGIGTDGKLFLQFKSHSYDNTNCNSSSNAKKGTFRVDCLGRLCHVRGRMQLINCRGVEVTEPFDCSIDSAGKIIYIPVKTESVQSPHSGGVYPSHDKGNSSSLPQHETDSRDADHNRRQPEIGAADATTSSNTTAAAGRHTVPDYLHSDKAVTIQASHFPSWQPVDVISIDVMRGTAATSATATAAAYAAPMGYQPKLSDLSHQKQSQSTFTTSNGENEGVQSGAGSPGRPLTESAPSACLIKAHVTFKDTSRIRFYGELAGSTVAAVYLDKITLFRAHAQIPAPPDPAEAELATDIKLDIASSSDSMDPAFTGAAGREVTEGGAGSGGNSGAGGVRSSTAEVETEVEVEDSLLGTELTSLSVGSLDFLEINALGGRFNNSTSSTNATSIGHMNNSNSSASTYRAYSTSNQRPHPSQRTRHRSQWGRREHRAQQGWRSSFLRALTSWLPPSTELFCILLLLLLWLILRTRYLHTPNLLWFNQVTMSALVVLSVLVFAGRRIFSRAKQWWWAVRQRPISNGRSFFVNGWNAWSFCGAVLHGQLPPRYSMPSVLVRAFHDGGDGAALRINLGLSDGPDQTDLGSSRCNRWWIVRFLMAPFTSTTRIKSSRNISDNSNNDINSSGASSSSSSSSRNSSRSGGGSIRNRGAVSVPGCEGGAREKGSTIPTEAAHDGPRQLERAYNGSGAEAGKGLEETKAAQWESSRDYVASDMFTALSDLRSCCGLVVGFLSQREQYGCVATNSLYNRLSVHVACDGVLVPSRQTRETDWLVLYSVTSLVDPFARYMEISAAENKVADLKGVLPKGNRVPAGWCSWYHFYEKITETDLEVNLAKMDAMRRYNGLNAARQGFNLFQIDDGYQAAWGDWTTVNPKKFPTNSLQSMVDKIKAANLLPGLWFAPFSCDQHSELAKKHFNWVLKRNGFQSRPSNSANCGKFFYGLDVTNPEVQDHVRHTVEVATGVWGFRYLKLDFLYSAVLHDAQQSYHDRTLTRAQAMWMAMDLVNSAAQNATTTATTTATNTATSTPSSAAVAALAKGSVCGSASGKSPNSPLFFRTSDKSAGSSELFLSGGSGGSGGSGEGDWRAVDEERGATCFEAGVQDKVCILGCGAPLGSMIGKVHANRVSAGTEPLTRMHACMRAIFTSLIGRLIDVEMHSFHFSQNLSIFPPRKGHTQSSIFVVSSKFPLLRFTIFCF